MRLYVIVPGFGNPYLDHKCDILKNNLSKLEKEAIDYEVCLCCYDIEASLPEWILLHPRIVVHYEKGIVGEFLDKHGRGVADRGSGFTHALIVLDDIEWEDNVSIRLVAEMQRVSGVQIISPCMTEDSKHTYDYLIRGFPKEPEMLIESSVLELFCYLMPISVLEPYIRYLEGRTNPWTWGMDLLVSEHFGIRVGFCNFMRMKHWYDRTCYDKHPNVNAAEGVIRFLAKYGYQLEDFRGRIVYKCGYIINKN